MPNLLTPDHPDARPRILELPAPTDDDVATLLDEIIVRVTKVLKKRGRLEDDLDDHPEPQLVFALRPAAGGATGTQDPLPPLCARKDGFSLHAATAVHQNDRQASSDCAAMASARRFHRAACRAPATGPCSTR